MKRNKSLLLKSFGLILPSTAIIFTTLPFDTFEKNNVNINNDSKNEIKNIVDSQVNLKPEDKEKILVFYDNASNIVKKYNLQLFKNIDNSGFYDKNKILENFNKSDIQKSLELMKDLDKSSECTNTKDKYNVLLINKAYSSWWWGVQTWHLNNSDVNNILTTLSVVSIVSGVTGAISSAIGGPIGVSIGIGLSLFSGATSVLREIIASRRGSNGIIFKLLFGFIPISIQAW